LFKLFFHERLNSPNAPPPFPSSVQCQIQDILEDFSNLLLTFLQSSLFASSRSARISANVFSQWLSTVCTDDTLTDSLDFASFNWSELATASVSSSVRARKFVE
jgi:hypothetical protein